MIQPIHAPQLSSAKTRVGLQSIGDLIPRLIRQYELQAELAQQREAEAAAKAAAIEEAAMIREAKQAFDVEPPCPAPSAFPAAAVSAPAIQQSFAWFE